jgi:hypothetical protein
MRIQNMYQFHVMYMCKIKIQYTKKKLKLNIYSIYNFVPKLKTFCYHMLFLTHKIFIFDFEQIYVHIESNYVLQGFNSIFNDV